MFFLYLGLWENLLETRVKLQNALNVVNQFPQHDCFKEALNSLKPEIKEKTDELIKESLFKMF